MLRLLPLLCLLGCAGRPLDTHCSSGVDCAPAEWCVNTWATSLTPLAEESAGNVCAASCATDADCEFGTCVYVGDGATLALTDIRYGACRE